MLKYRLTLTGAIVAALAFVIAFACASALLDSVIKAIIFATLVSIVSLPGLIQQLRELKILRKFVQQARRGTPMSMFELNEFMLAHHLSLHRIDTRNNKLWVMVNGESVLVKLIPNKFNFNITLD